MVPDFKPEVQHFRQANQQHELLKRSGGFAGGNPPKGDSGFQRASG
jgi:hypothetical protein